VSRLPLVLLLLATACGGGDGGGDSAPEPDRTRVSIGGVALEVEVARTDEQRRAGLRDREVPPGTGMAFPYEPAQRVRFTMSEVELPLVAVFSRAGRAVSVEQLEPCAGTVAQCPLYGPDEPVDLVVEAAPGSLPAARPGDPVVLG